LVLLASRQTVILMRSIPPTRSVSPMVKLRSRGEPGSPVESAVRVVESISSGPAKASK
jgi:hypothetical protein